jgi:hypothetical protein
VEVIRERVKTSFDQSQIVVPVKTGALRASGDEQNIPDGAQIHYGKEYASFVERGFAGGNIHVNSYVKKNGTKVRSYDYYSPPRTGRHFIENPLKDSFKSLDDSFDQKLHQHFKIVRKE